MLTEKRQPCVFLLGGFDGLHVGHKKLIDRAKEYGLPLAAMTILGGKGKDLFTLSERQALFALQGVTSVTAYVFDEKFKNTSPEDFLSSLTDDFEIAAFVCGEDFRFGKDASGTPDFIRKRTGKPVQDLDVLTLNGEKIGMTSVKKLLSEGNVKEANRLLLQPFFVRGEVVEGRKVGRTLSFPTANIRYPEEKFPLKNGVYAVHVFLDGKRYKGIANKGACPTFDVMQEKVEAYFDGFSGNLYGREIDVFFDRYLREIRRFDSREELVEQLRKDKEMITK